MNRDEIWRQLKDDKTLVYNEPILDVFLRLTRQLKKSHYQELSSNQKKELSAELRLKFASNKKEIEDAIKDGAADLEERFVESIRNNELDIIRYFTEERGFFSFTALRVAGYKGDLETIKYLINKKFQKEDLNDLKNASMYFHEALGQAIAYVLEGASQGGHLDVFKYFVEEWGVKSEEIFEIPALEMLDVYPVSQNHKDILEYLSEKLGGMSRDQKLGLYKRFYIMWKKRPEQGGSNMASFFAKKLGQSLQQ